MPVNPSALAMAAFGFIVLFGGLFVTLYIAFKSGGYEEAEPAEEPEPAQEPPNAGEE
ncbi:MAG: MetS family NSS transporter small subunit [Halodesulfurarchaeum sp.]